MPRDVDQAYRLYAAATARGGPEGASATADEAAAAIERLDFERRLGAPPPPTLDGALRAVGERLEELAAGILRPLAAAGDADAQLWLGAVEEAGRGSDREEAIRWYRAAALQGDAEAAHRLARLFDESRTDLAGRRIGDVAEKVRWLRRAAEAGHRDAARDLAQAYREGRGVAADRAESERWNARALRADAAWARLSRPACVEDEAAPELLPAFLACNRGDADGLGAALLPLAEGGHARAQAWVAFLTAGGPGTGGGHDPRLRPDAQRAARWYARAAAQGLPSAMHDYGVALEHGFGVPVDEAAARGWYEKAAAAGFPAAREALAALGARRP